MDKKGIIEKVASETGLSKARVKEVFDCAQDQIVKALHEGEEVSFLGVGAFKIKDIAAREGLNPQTKEKIQIPATKRVTFSVSKSLSKSVADALK